MLLTLTVSQTLQWQSSASSQVLKPSLFLSSVNTTRIKTHSFPKGERKETPLSLPWAPVDSLLHFTLLYLRTSCQLLIFCLKNEYFLSWQHIILWVKLRDMCVHFTSDLPVCVVDLCLYHSYPGDGLNGYKDPLTLTT